MVRQILVAKINPCGECAWGKILAVKIDPFGETDPCGETDSCGKIDPYNGILETRSLWRASLWQLHSQKSYFP